MRGCRIALIALVLGPLQAGRAQAVPPPGAAVGGTKLDVQHWIEHRVIMGERLAEIARRYRVEIADVAEWNGLDADKPVLKAGQRLRILTAESAAERRRKSYVVREGDTWQRIANRFGVPLSRLRNQWNPGVEEPLPGETIVLFVEVEPRPDSETLADSAEPEATTEAVPTPTPAPAKAAVAPPAKAAPAKAPPAKATAPAKAAVAPPPPTKATPVKAAPAKAAPAMAAVQPQPSTQADALAAVIELRPNTGTRARPSTPARANAKPDANTTPSTHPPFPAPQTSAKVAPPRPKSPSLPGPQPTPLSPDLPIVAVPSGSLSAGGPARGRLINGVQVPANDALYTIRNPDNSWGSSHAIEQLQRGIARFRQDSGFERELLICDMSRQRGGRFRPHASHRSGRDVDIQLPVKLGYPEGHIPLTIGAVDWDAAWALVRALVSTGEVKYIFLSRSRQRPLYQAALRAGETKASLEGFIQFPTNEKTALLRHSQGHVKHLHVRFKCALHEPKCLE